MSTEKSLKHLKSKEEFHVANVSNYFEKHSGQDSSLYIQHTFLANWGLQKNRFPSTKRTSRNWYALVAATFIREQYKPEDALDEVVIRNNVQEFYIHRHQLKTINNLLSVLKTDNMSTIHQNSTRNNMIITQKVYKFKNDA